MDIAQVRIDSLDGLIVYNSLQTEHTVSRRVVRTEVYHVVVRLEQTVLGLNKLTEVVEVPL